MKRKKDFEFKIMGMHCPSCALRVENAVKSINGVIEAKVDFSSEQIKVVCSKDVEPIHVVERIRNVGYDVLTEKMIISVVGLKTEKDEDAINSVKYRLDGIIDIMANPISSNVLVEYNPLKISEGEIRKAIADMGYDIVGVEREFSLEKELEHAEETLRSLRKKVIIGFIFTIPVLISTSFSFLLDLMGLKLYIDPITQALMASIVQVYCGAVFYLGAYKSLKYKAITMDVLVVLSTTIAYVYSMLEVLLMMIYGHSAAHFFEASMAVISFVLLGRYMEIHAKQSTMFAIRDLIQAQPKKARVIKDGKIVEVHVNDIKVGEKVIVRMGERIPIDGIIVEGDGYVDESILTGEPRPIYKREGDRVLGGSILVNGTLVINATRVGENTFLSQILMTIRHAQRIKLPVQNITDRVVAWFTPIVSLIAILSFIYWFFVFGNLHFAILVFVAVFAVACPCALGIATPTAVSVGIGKAAKYGVLIRSGDIFEVMPKCEVVLFDKTGTLTEGKISVSDVVILSDMNEENFLRIVALAESRSNHPIADTIMKYAQTKIGKIKAEAIKEFEEFPGMGVMAIIDNYEVLIGNEKLMKKYGINVSSSIDVVNKFRSEGKTVIFVAMNKKIVGLLALEDKLKPEAKHVVNYLRTLGLQVAIISGDNEITVRSIAKKLGIEEYYANLLPDEKQRIIKQIQMQGKKVIMVGDGINDAPSIKQSDVGIAIGVSSDISAEAGDALICNRDLREIIFLFELSKKVLRKIKQNIFWAFLYNTILIPFAAGVFLPIFGVFLRPEYGALAMALSDLFIVSNAIILKMWHPKHRE